MSGPVLRYPGAKWRLADWIVGHLPPHEVYLEPFFGSGAVLLNKPPARCETVVDRDGRIVNLFRTMRDQPDELAAAVALTPYARAEYELSDGPPTGDAVEDARRFLVRVWMAHAGRTLARSGWRVDLLGRVGTPMPGQWQGLPGRILDAAQRLRDVHVECRPALAVLAGLRDARVCVYADPPYPVATLASARDRYYAHTMDDADHAALLDALVAHPGPVVLSGYACPLYDDRLGPAGWRRAERPTVAYRGAARTESLWVNAAAADGGRQRTLFAAGSGGRRWRRRRPSAKRSGSGAGRRACRSARSPGRRGSRRPPWRRSSGARGGRAATRRSRRWCRWLRAKRHRMGRPAPRCLGSPGPRCSGRTRGRGGPTRGTGRRAATRPRRRSPSSPRPST